MPTALERPNPFRKCCRARRWLLISTRHGRGKGGLCLPSTRERSRYSIRHVGLPLREVWQDAEGVGPDNRRAPSGNAELLVDVSGVLLDGLRRDDQLPGDLLVREPRVEEMQHFGFAPGKWLVELVSEAGPRPGRQ